MIDAAILNAVALRAGELALNEASLAHLRREWPGLHFTLCSEDDVPARLVPALEGDGFNLYLVSNAEHCIAFTDRLDAATGVVLAANPED
jgi:hypothetical protein